MFFRNPSEMAAPAGSLPSHRRLFDGAFSVQARLPAAMPSFLTNGIFERPAMSDSPAVE